MEDARTVNAFFSLQIPTRLVEGVVALQEQRETVRPQRRDEIHITLTFLHEADAVKLADAAALASGKTWPVPSIRFTGEVRHGSWDLQRNPDYRYDEATAQKGEQIRLGVEPVPELLGIHADLTRNLGGAEEDYWPHVTLGLAREDIPASSMEDLDIPSESGPARSLDLRQAGGESGFRILVRRPLAGDES
ncbi:2'-5' RNA ligase family protein [Streptomyces daliensis]|uniref:RNA 2',3'-cyclic phosphodiesterase n=1 Tax=Streptomyces daliensis TaxID=299421 RepID=A0A8T4INQ6_9ACTN|nr:hypothetical protein [Streptomyces daliensis]